MAQRVANDNSRYGNKVGSADFVPITRSNLAFRTGSKAWLGCPMARNKFAPGKRADQGPVTPLADPRSGYPSSDHPSGGARSPDHAPHGARPDFVSPGNGGLTSRGTVRHS